MYIMDHYYSEASHAIAEYMNSFGMKLDRTISFQDHEWWPTLNRALYTILETHFKIKKIHVSLTMLNKEWLRRRALLRGYINKELNDEELFIYDIIDTLPYYNHTWEYNPPFEYTFHESFSL